MVDNINDKETLIAKNALFIADDAGVIVITDIDYKSKVTAGEVVFDGKNTIILNRNNEDYFTLQNIPPKIREKIKETEYVTIVEKIKDEDIYSYRVKVRMVDDMGFSDNWLQYAGSIIEKLEKQMSPEKFAELRRQLDEFNKKVNE